MSVAQVPASLLKDRSLRPKAKLVWIACTLVTGGAKADPGLLAEAAGVTKETACKSIQLLAAHGWLAEDGRARVAGNATGEGSCSLPAKLLAAPRLGAQPILLYCLLQLLPGFEHQSGRFTYEQLSAMAPISPESARNAEWKLVDRGWLRVEREGRSGPVHFRLRDPEAERVRALLADMETGMKGARHPGKAILRQYLALMVDTPHYLDDAPMSFLYDYDYLEQLTLDRYYYRDNVALLFDGPLDHSMLGARKERRQLASRLRTCERHDINALVIRPSDLSWERMQSLLAGWLPKGRKEVLAQVIEFLDSFAEAYRQSLISRRPAQARIRRHMVYRSVSTYPRSSASSW